MPWLKPSDPAADVICLPSIPPTRRPSILVPRCMGGRQSDRDPEPVRTFGTVTSERHRLADWFESQRVARDGRDAVRGQSVSVLRISPSCRTNTMPPHHIPRPKRRVTDWADYNEALRQRGSLTVWFTDAAIAAWKAAPAPRRAVSRTTRTWRSRQP